MTAVDQCNKAHFIDSSDSEDREFFHFRIIYLLVDSNKEKVSDLVHFSSQNDHH